MGSADAISRRAFVRTTVGATAAAGATGVARAQSPPDFDGWMSDVDNYEQVTDETGKQTVTVSVGASGNGGNFAFAPPVIQIDPGTTVQWKWTGQGGGHNVVDEGGEFESGSPVSEAGVNFEHDFEDAGTYKYYCQPHRSLGMKGVVVVGPLETGGAGGGGQAETDPQAMGVPFQAHWVGIAAILATFIALVFTFFLLKYGVSPHASGGN